jgi:ketosteroid isomerase-like protein
MVEEQKFVPAYRPEDCDRLLMQAIENGDLETTVALYEPGAVLFTESGDLLKIEQIRKHNQEFISLKTKTRIEKIDTAISGDGTLATSRMKCTAVYQDPKTGKEVTMHTNTLEVLRKQLDGTWRFVIDDPLGGNRMNTNV